MAGLFWLTNKIVLLLQLVGGDGGWLVGMGGTAVTVGNGGTFVAVGGMGVFVGCGGLFVAVGETAVFVGCGGTGVFVGAGGCTTVPKSPAAIAQSDAYGAFQV